MSVILEPWDYLIVTASNEAQAAAYERQLRLRQRLGLLVGARAVEVVADPGGRRIGTGGSTVYCLMEVLNRELASRSADPADRQAWAHILCALRVLIVHAGGDSRRLPAYGPCGKVFIPVPGESDSALGPTLFDRQLPIYLGLPPMPHESGQFVITAGDVLLSFDPGEVAFASRGVTGLSCLATPEQASKHGVFCPDPEGRVRLFLQKPTPREQVRHQAVNRYGQVMLDIGVLNFDATAAMSLLEMCDVKPGADGRLAWSGQMGRAIEDWGLDIYREIACAMGTEASASHVSRAAKASGSKWDDALLERAHQTLSSTAFSVQLLPQCGFLHFGTTHQLIISGIDLSNRDHGVTQLQKSLSINNDVREGGELVGANSWVEGCVVTSTVDLNGWNVLVGVDVDEPFTLPRDACLDVVPGRNRDGEKVWFVRCYGASDTFKDSVDDGATLCGVALLDWLALVGAKPEDVWDPESPPRERTLWNARVFPAEVSAAGYRRWLWTFDVSSASEDQRRAWLAADRYSAAEMAQLGDPQAFHQRRDRIRAEEVRRSLRRMFRLDSGFSAAELALTLLASQDPVGCIAELLAEGQWYLGRDGCVATLESFTFSRIMHTLASAIARLALGSEAPIPEILTSLAASLQPTTDAWLRSMGLGITPTSSPAEWVDRARAVAFRQLGRTIVASGSQHEEIPIRAIRSDEIVWGRAPARLDLGGGWSDTPPYSLEHGGCVINAAVDLNDQPPIHAYARVTDRPVIRIGSIDLGTRIEITGLDDLLDFRSGTSEFSLAKAALAISGFSPEAARWPDGITLPEMLERFGGGIDLTTLAAIPKGSGLGTSSIVGAVILAVVQKMMGRSLTRRELFHAVLRLEQTLTTGGGWQDQIGGAVDGVKVATAEAGLIPDARIHYILPDVLDPRANGGSTLLYYTGITRLAKDILQQVVGRYLDRDRTAMATLRQIHALPRHVAEAMGRKDLAAFGRLIDVAWRLNKQLDPNSTTPEIETLLDRVRPHIYGAKLLGAGGGGFLLLVCKSPSDAAAIRQELDADPPNDRGRFFDFDISREGLVVTVC